VPDFTPVVLVVFENHEATSIAGNPAAPTFNALAHRYVAMTDYTAVAIPVCLDEGTSDEAGGGHIEALALGPTVRHGSRFSKATNHYGLLRTIEDAWGPTRLGFSRTGISIGGIWRK
jgi:hypothetical protein